MWDKRNFTALCRAYEHQITRYAYAKLTDWGFYGVKPMGVAPDTLARLFEAYRAAGRLFPVWNGGSDKTIYTAPAINFVVRAAHDLTHIQLRAPFDLDGEIAVFNQQAKETALACPYLDILEAEVVGQTQAFYENGEFPDDQFQFALEYLNNKERSKS